MHPTRATVEEGIAPGSCLALLRASQFDTYGRCHDANLPEKKQVALNKVNAMDM
ncbi:MAG: hypothetical protein IPP22_04300 [Nitrosomonas sp.]|nr:hypothetical protein [Nitrosomonas sp.]